MKILAVDTSTRVGSAAILDGDSVVGEMAVAGGESHSRRMLPLLNMLLGAGRVSLEEIEGFAVGIGPGSFTGLRIGLAMAKGLAFSLGRPLVGVSSLEALAMNGWASSGDVCPMFDARKDEVYAALYRFSARGRLVRITKESVHSPARFLHGLDSRGVTFLGDGAHRYRRIISKAFRGRAHIAPACLSYPRAANIGLLALRKITEGRTDDIGALEPRYLRLSDAEMKIRRRM